MDDILECPHCGYTDDESEFDTDKYWDNDGNHILYHICPKCGKPIYDKEN